MSTPDGILREVAEALERGGGRYLGAFSGCGIEVHAPKWQTGEDVFQALPEHLWERVSVTRVAPGRFVVEEILRKVGRL